MADLENLPQGSVIVWDTTHVPPLVAQRLRNGRWSILGAPFETVATHELLQGGARWRVVSAWVSVTERAARATGGAPG